MNKTKKVTVRKNKKYIRTNARGQAVKCVTTKHINRMALVMHVVRRGPAEGMTSADVYNAIIKDGVEITRTYVSCALRLLAGEGFSGRNELVREVQEGNKDTKPVYIYYFNMMGTVRTKAAMLNGHADKATTARLVG